MAIEAEDLLVPVTFKIHKSDKAALERVRVRDGINLSEQIRRAIELWLHSKGFASTSTPLTPEEIDQ